MSGLAEWRAGGIVILMDKWTKNYIDETVKPLLARIDHLERINDELRVQVKYLESLLLTDRAYAKPTISAANHMRDARTAHRQDSPERRPTWNSRTKIDYLPALTLPEPPTPDKTTAKPPIPRLTRSNSKRELDEPPRNPSTSKKTSNARNQGNQFSKKEEELNNQSHRGSTRMSRNGREGVENDEETAFEQNMGLIKEWQGEIGMLNYKFQQLVRSNTEILSSMKHNNQIVRDNLTHAATNRVHTPAAPSSDHHSHTPIERSFLSDSHPHNPQGPK